MSKRWSNKKRYANFDWQMDGKHFSSSVCSRVTVNQFITDKAKDYNVFPVNIKVTSATN
jgi:hypothetical protein